MGLFCTTVAEGLLSIPPPPAVSEHKREREMRASWAERGIRLIERQTATRKRAKKGKTNEEGSQAIDGLLGLENEVLSCLHRGNSCLAWID